jgi:predicted glutamate--cysteine ligase
MRLSKGFEVEMYTGTPQGDIVGLSDRIVAALDGFVREPDNRNVEYTTPPCSNYDRLLCALVKPRLRLRHYLKRLGDFTLLPGSTLSLGDSRVFHRSDPENAYHTYIEKTYGTTVVTASIHINVGIADPETLMRACRLVRLEAPLYLALSAASPFLDGKVTGSHSSRWQVFPPTPKHVPLFHDHAHFIRWTNEQLALGTMQNVRHLWASVRPNGDRRPYNLNRLELRICDLVTNPLDLLAITALLEARLLHVIQNPNVDPLSLSKLSEENLLLITQENEQSAARSSLDAPLKHWVDGRTILAKDWILELYEESWEIAHAEGFSCFLSPVKRILKDGNTAQQWLRQVAMGKSPREVLIKAMQAMEVQELELEDQLCAPIVA